MNCKTLFFVHHSNTVKAIANSVVTFVSMVGLGWVRLPCITSCQCMMPDILIERWITPFGSSGIRIK